MHANKKNMVNAILILAGFTKCRQSSAGILPCDRAAAGGGRAVTLGCGDAGLILRKARRRNGNNSRLAFCLHIATRLVIDRVTSVYLNQSETTPPCV